MQGKVLSWNNLSSQAAFILCPLVLSWLYSFSHKGSYYFCLVFAVVAVVSLCLILRMPNAMMFGKAGVKELPVVSEGVTKGNNLEEEEKEEKGNDESSKVSPQCTEGTSKDSLKGSGVEAPKAPKAEKMVDGVDGVGAVSVEMGKVESHDEVKVASEKA